MDVVIPTYDNKAQLVTCLDALRGQSDEDLHVLVCVDGSTDGTVGYLERASFPFRLDVLQHPDLSNHGRGAARNLAVPRLEHEFVLFLDSDMRLAPDGIAQHLDVLSSRQCVSVGAIAYTNSGEDLWARYLTTRGAAKAPAGATISPLDFHTANSAARSADVVALGGFDESLTGYGGEDVEFGLRLAESGLTFVSNAAARAISTEPKSVDAALEQRRAFARTNLRTMRAKHPDGPAPFWIDRIDSPRWRDRATRALMNPLTDAVADLALRVGPFAIQRRILDYKVLREVWAGYREGSP